MACNIFCTRLRRLVHKTMPAEYRLSPIPSRPPQLSRRQTRPVRTRMKMLILTSLMSRYGLTKVRKVIGKYRKLKRNCFLRHLRMACAPRDFLASPAIIPKPKYRNIAQINIAISNVKRASTSRRMTCAISLVRRTTLPPVGGSIVP